MFSVHEAPILPEIVTRTGTLLIAGRIRLKAPAGQQKRKKRLALRTSYHEIRGAQVYQPGVYGIILVVDKLGEGPVGGRDEERGPDMHLVQSQGLDLVADGR